MPQVKRTWQGCVRPSASSPACHAAGFRLKMSYWVRIPQFRGTLMSGALWVGPGKSGVVVLGLVLVAGGPRRMKRRSRASPPRGAFEGRGTDGQTVSRRPRVSALHPSSAVPLDPTGEYPQHSVVPGATPAIYPSPRYYSPGLLPDGRVILMRPACRLGTGDGHPMLVLRDKTEQRDGRGGHRRGPGMAGETGR